MNKEIRNQRDFLTESERIAYEENAAWEQYNDALKAAEVEHQINFEREVREHFEAQDEVFSRAEEFEKMWDEENADEQLPEKNRSTRSGRRKSTRYKNRALKRNAENASKNMRKRISDASKATEQYGKSAANLKRGEKLLGIARKRNLF